MKPYYESPDGYFTLYHGDCMDIMPQLTTRADIIFADPPYFLSGSGTTCAAGKRVSVKKAKWDAKTNLKTVYEFNLNWIELASAATTEIGTIWVSGTYHNIYSVGMALLASDLEIINNITFQKPNPPPNLSCRFFTHSTETILWARKPKAKHLFNYSDMRRENNHKQMKDVWPFVPPLKKEKIHGRHPTQKPEALISRIIRASTLPGDLVLDPFAGSGTTNVVATKLGRRSIGIEREQEYCDLIIKRYEGNINGI